MTPKNHQSGQSKMQFQRVNRSQSSPNGSKQTAKRDQKTGGLVDDGGRSSCGTIQNSAQAQHNAANHQSVAVSWLKGNSKLGWLQNGTRKASILIGAAGVTLALLSLMTGLIADEFQPQDRVDLASFEINPRPDDVPLLMERKPPKLDPIEVPPAPPIVDIIRTDQPSEPIIVPGQPKGVFDPKIYVIRTSVPIIPSDTDPQPLIRVPPIMPPRATRSGHCQMAFDISPEGTPFNIKASSCSETVFQRPAVRAVGKWVYRPEIKDGLPVMRTGLTTTIRFKLTDDRGGIIPE